MKLYGGYNGKRVQKSGSFKLFRHYKGKRLAKKINENGFIYQTIELFCGKVKNFMNKIKELSGYVDYEEMDQEFLGLPSHIEQEEPDYLEYEPLEEGFTNIEIIDASTLDDIEDVVYFVQAGYVVIVDYRALNSETRKEFDKQLSKELFPLGTHLTHISNSAIVCAGRHITVTDTISKPKEGKIYDIGTYMQR